MPCGPTVEPLAIALDQGPDRWGLPGGGLDPTFVDQPIEAVVLVAVDVSPEQMIADSTYSSDSFLGDAAFGPDFKDFFESRASAFSVVALSVS